MHDELYYQRFPICVRRVYLQCQPDDDNISNIILQALYGPIIIYWYKCTIGCAAAVAHIWLVFAYSHTVIIYRHAPRATSAPLTHVPQCPLPYQVDIYVDLQCTWGLTSGFGGVLPVCSRHKWRQLLLRGNQRRKSAHADRAQQHFGRGLEEEELLQRQFQQLESAHRLFYHRHGMGDVLHIAWCSSSRDQRVRRAPVRLVQPRRPHRPQDVLQTLVDAIRYRQDDGHTLDQR